MPRSNSAIMVCLLAFGVAACQKKAPPAARDAGPPPAASTATRALVAPPLAPGEIGADLAASTVTVSVVGGLDKSQTVAATMSLKLGRITLSGGASPAARFSIDLTSFDSHVPLRNDRVKQVFFDGGETADLVVDAIPEEALAKLRNKRLVAKVKTQAALTIHGRTTKIEVLMDAGYTDRGGLWIKTSQPVQLGIEALGLEDNKRKLMRICGHEAISDTVGVEASIEFPPG